MDVVYNIENSQVNIFQLEMRLMFLSLDLVQISAIQDRTVEVEIFVTVTVSMATIY